MNKTELIAEVAKKCAMSKKDAEKAVSATFDTIAEVLCAGSRYHRSRLQARQGAQGPDQQVIRTIGKASGFPDFYFDRSTQSCVWTNI